MFKGEFTFAPHQSSTDTTGRLTVQGSPPQLGSKSYSQANSSMVLASALLNDNKASQSNFQAIDADIVTLIEACWN